MTAIPKRTLVQIGAGALILVGVVAAAFGLNRGANASPAETPIPVRVTSNAPAGAAPTGVGAATPQLPIPPPTSSAPAAPARAVTVIAKAAGDLASANQTTLAFQSSGRIEDIKVKEDDHVKAGDVIATLDTAVALDAQVAQAQAALDSAMANFATVKAGPTVDDVLVAKGNLDHAKGALDQAQAAYNQIGGSANTKIAATLQALNLQQASSAYETALGQFNLTVNHPTDAELKSAQAAVATAQAALQTAKQNAANAQIVAPFDGTVVWLSAQLGESAVPGSPVATVADLSHMQVLVNVDEVSGAGIQTGQPVSITIDALPDQSLNGHISLIGLLATASGNLVSIPVTVDIDPTDAPIYPGLSATVQFQGGNQ